MDFKSELGIELSSQQSMGGDKDAIILEDSEVLYRQGGQAKFFYIIHKGKIGLFNKSKDRFFLEEVVEQGDFLCEKHLFEESLLERYAVSLGKSEVLKVDINQMKLVLKNCPDWVRDLFNTINKRLTSSLEILEKHQITDERLRKKIPLGKEQEEKIRKNILKK